MASNNTEPSPGRGYEQADHNYEDVDQVDGRYERTMEEKEKKRGGRKQEECEVYRYGLKHAAPPALPPRHRTMEEREKKRGGRKQKECEVYRSGLKHAALYVLPPRHPVMDEKEKERADRKQEGEGCKHAEVGGVKVEVGSGLKRVAPDLPPRNAAMLEKAENKGANIKREQKEDERHKYEDIDLELGGINVILGAGLKHAAPPALPSRHRTMMEEVKERAHRKQEEGEFHKYDDLDLELGGINVILGSGLKHATPPALPPRHHVVEEKEKERADRKKEVEDCKHGDLHVDMGGVKVEVGSGLKRVTTDLPPRNAVMMEKEKEQASREEAEQAKEEDVTQQEAKEDAKDDGEANKEEKESLQEDGMNKQTDSNYENVDLEDGDETAQGPSSQRAARPDTSPCHLDTGDHVRPDQKEVSGQYYKTDETTEDGGGDERSLAAKTKGTSISNH
uniref:Uncharacterized protein n=1 Tax=Branchiostoma floridae TaxID=7739 RepID=C3ZGB9_BRAFL|eukprot:XP_002592429.1 hypothetical protein BRAFLDRAFT_67296 [Branchiostoma floridae]